MKVIHRYAILFLFALTAFGGLLRTPFLYDDLVVVKENQLLRTPSGLQEIWRGRVDDRDEMNGAFRPFLLTLFSFLGRAADFHPFAFRLSSIALHALNALLLLSLARGVFGLGPTASWLVSLVFLLHPVQTTSLGFSWKQSDLWIAFYSLLSILALNRSSMIPALLIFLFALTFKESAMVIPLLWLAIEPLRTEVGKKKRTATIGIALLASFAFYLALPKLITPSPVPDGFPGSRLSYFLTQLSVFPLYAKALLWPTALTIDRSIPVVGHVSLAGAFSIGILVIAIAFLLFGTVKRWNFALAGLLGVIWLIPTSSFQPLSILYDETRLYLFVGFLALAVAGLAASRRITIRPGIRFAAVATFALLLIVVTRHGTCRWRSEEALWKSALAADPTSVRTHYQIGILARKARALDEAEEHFRAALALNPKFPNARLDLGIVLGQKGDLDGAAKEFSVLLASTPHWAALGHYHLGLDAIYRNDFSRARNEFQTVGKLSPDSGDADRGEAFLAEKLGKNDEAVTAWKKYLSKPRRSPGERETAERTISRLAGGKRVR